MPASLERIVLEVDVAGRHYAPPPFGPTPNQRTSFFWDGKDHLGRELNGRQPITVRIGHVYKAVYMNPEDAAGFVACLPGASTPLFARLAHARALTLSIAPDP